MFSEAALLNGETLISLAQAVRLGSSWLTSQEAITRFSERLTPTDPAAPSVRLSFARNKASESAGQQLEAAGA